MGRRWSLGMIEKSDGVAPRRSPSQGLREVVVIMGSLTSCDPGDIYETIANYRQDGIRVSVIGLAAEVHVCKALCKETGGEG